jgi:hypothetical protein
MIREDFNSRDMTVYYSIIAIWLALAFLLGGAGPAALALFGGALLVGGIAWLRDVLTLLRGR